MSRPSERAGDVGAMRRTLARSIICVTQLSSPPSLVLIQPARAEKAPEIDPRASLGVVQQWIYNYRAKPDYAHVPAAVRVLFHAQTFKEPENAGIYLGFIAGAIGSNPAKAEKLIASFFPVAAGRRMGDRPRHRLFGAAGLAQRAAPGGAADAGAARHDRQLSGRQAADPERHPAGRDQARHDGQAEDLASPKIRSPRRRRRSTRR